MNRYDRPIRVMAISAAFWAWCGLVSFPMIVENVDLANLAHAFISTSTTVVICQAVGLALFVATVAVCCFDRFGTIIARLNLAQIAMLLIISLSFLIQLHDDELAALTGMMYTALILAMAVTLSALWALAPADLERCLNIGSVILCLFGATAIAILGWPAGRNIGSIQPNLFAAPLLVGFILSQFHPGVLGFGIRILCFAMIALVSARFAIIGCMLALTLFHLTFNPLSPAKISVSLVAVIAAAILWPQIISLLALDDSLRDIASGFSGRDQYWSSALAAIAGHPLGIGFKRSIGDEAGHNGYLKTLLEFGIAGGGLIIAFIASTIVSAGLDAIGFSQRTLRQRRFDSARFGGLVALAFGAFFQPQLFSLGDAFAMSLLFLLFRPALAASSVTAPAARRYLPAMPAHGTPLSRRPAGSR